MSVGSSSQQASSSIGVRVVTSVDLLAALAYRSAVLRSTCLSASLHDSVPCVWKPFCQEMAGYIAYVCT
ncbi:MAG: hypothetical protein ACK53Y_06155, partial [bacterium]